MLVNFVVVLTILLGCCGLALDVGLLELKRVQMQNAADAAAMGAMFEGERGNTDWVAAGINDAGLAGFVNGTNSISVTVTNPPASGTMTTNLGAYQAVVSQPVQTLFMGKILTIRAQSTAVIPACGYFMGVLATVTAMTLQSAGFAASCPVYVGTNVGGVGGVDGFSNANTDAFYVSGTAADSAAATGSITPAPTFGFPQMTDPLAYIPTPTVPSNCAATGVTLGQLNTHTVYPTPLYPGYYCGGLSLLWTTVTLLPGTYIISGGLNIVSSTINGSGVTIYMTKDANSGYGQVNITGSDYAQLGGPSVINLSAPTDTSYGGTTGVLLYGDRNWTGTAMDIKLQSCSFNGDGIMYFPRTGIYSYHCLIRAPHYFGMVVDNLWEFGRINPNQTDINLSTNFSYIAGGNPFRPRESLAE